MEGDVDGVDGVDGVGLFTSSHIISRSGGGGGGTNNSYEEGRILSSSSHYISRQLRAGPHHWLSQSQMRDDSQ